MTTGHGPIRVLLVEDHPLYRKGLRVLLGEVEDLSLIHI